MTPNPNRRGHSYQEQNQRQLRLQRPLFPQLFVNMHVISIVRRMRGSYYTRVRFGEAYSTMISNTLDNPQWELVVGINNGPDPVTGELREEVIEISIIFCILNNPFAIRRFRGMPYGDHRVNVNINLAGEARPGQVIVEEHSRQGDGPVVEMERFFIRATTVVSGRPEEPCTAVWQQYFTYDRVFEVQGRLIRFRALQAFRLILRIHG